ncbi:MAG: mechanosensitive ion channel family protein [Thermoproteus sp.]|jgi:small-conductance mechanosensitive channel|nr:mechanosensitive ion channel family protein [Thermoproteus sp.]
MRRITLALLRTISEFILIGVAGAAVYVLIDLLAVELKGLPPYIFDVAKAVVIIGAGVAGVKALGYFIIAALRPRIGDRAYSVGNTFKVLGYIAAITAGFFKIEATSQIALLGGTVAGIVLGLALQPTLGNLFAGLLIIATNFVRVGDAVRILNPQVPYQWASSPPYKYFSPDYIYPALVGKVVEVNLFYTVVVTDRGDELKIPNSIMLEGAIVDESASQWSQQRIVNVRVELPLSVVDLDRLEGDIRKLLSDLDVRGIYLNEQSDKDYVIVLIRLAVRKGNDWRLVKSEALKRLLKMKAELIKANEQRFLCFTKGVCKQP